MNTITLFLSLMGGWNLFGSTSTNRILEEDIIGI